MKNILIKLTNIKQNTHTQKKPLQTSSKFQWLFSVEDRAEGGRDQDVTSLVR